MKCRMLSLIAAAALSLTCFRMPAVSAADAEISDWNFGYSRVFTAGAAAAYQRMADAFRNLDFDIRFLPKDGFTYDDVQQAALTFFQNDPELFYICADLIAQDYADGSIRIKMKLRVPGYAEPQAVTAESVAAVRQCVHELNQKADDILAGMPASADTDYAKALYLHDYVASHTQYAFSVDASGRRTEDDQTAYGALVKEQAICAGFANAYTLLLRRAGLSAWTVHGFAGGDSHGWVLHFIDGDCVYTDPTWNRLYHRLPSHVWFGLSLEAMSESSHTLSEEFQRDVPACGHDGHTYISAGDVNANGIVNIADAVMLCRILAEDADIEPTLAGMDNADTDKDDLLTAEDAALLLKMLAVTDRKENDL